MYTRKIAYFVIGLVFVLCGSGLSFADYYGSVTDAIGDNDPRNRAGGAYDFASGTARVTGGNLIFSTTFAPGTFSSENWRAAYIYAGIDLDRNPSTGHPGINADDTDSTIFGMDYFVAWGGSSVFPGYGLYRYRAAEGDWFAVDRNLSATYSVSADDPSVGIATVTIPLSDFRGASVGTFNFKFKVNKLTSSNAISTTLDYMPNPGSFGTTAPVPTLSPVASQTILWPPNQQMVPITIQANASDKSGMPVVLSAKIVCNETGSGFWTTPVINQETGVISLSLQAARDGNDKNGRQYTITVTATNHWGNASTSNVTILVPHDQGKN